MQELILISMIAVYPMIIGLIEKPTERMCIESVSKNGLMLGNIKEEYHTYTVCLNAVRNHGMAIQYIRNKSLIDKQLAEIACRKNGEAIFYVPYKIIDEELTLLCSQNMFKLNPVEKPVRTPQSGIYDYSIYINFYRKMFPSSPYFNPILLPPSSHRHRIKPVPISGLPFWPVSAETHTAPAEVSFA